MRLERQYFAWLIPIGHYGSAHAFCENDRLSVCVKRRRVDPQAWVPDVIDEGGKRRPRCVSCAYLIPRLNMVELAKVPEAAE